MALNDGTIWKNLVTPAKAKVAETLNEYRGNYLYNLLDDNLRRFNAEIPQFVLWDDHEVRNNWYPTNSRSRALASQARRAFIEYNPIRASGPSSLIYRSCCTALSSKCSRLTFARIERRTPTTARRNPAVQRRSRAGDRSNGSSAGWPHQRPHGRSSRAICRLVSSYLTARTPSKRSRMEMDLRSGASMKWPICCDSFDSAAFAM